MRSSSTNRPDTLTVSLYGREVGTLTRLIDESIVFAFDPNYESDLNRPLLSLSYLGPEGRLAPGRARTATRLPPFFSNLLPEGHLRDYLAQKLDINPGREFFLLAGLGLDLPGAVTVAPTGSMSSYADRELSRYERQETPVMRFSLAGVQLKFSAFEETQNTFTIPASGMGGSWIVKLPSRGYEKLPEAESAMLQFAHAAGISVPEFKLVETSTIEGLPAEFRQISANSLAVKRFDRTPTGGRVHMEDFAQVYGIYSKDKYQKAGCAHIARVLWIQDQANSYPEFIRRLVFTILIGNGDMHLKNWSVLYTDHRKPTLSPAYDFVPTTVYIPNDTLALNIGATKYFEEATIEKFKKMAVQAGASERLTVIAVRESVEQIEGIWRKKSAELGLPEEFRQTIHKHLYKMPLLKGLLK